MALVYPDGMTNFPVSMGQFTPSGAAQQILPADPNRLMLIVTCSAFGFTTTLSLRAPDGGGFKFVVSPGIYTCFTWRDHGPLVWESLWTETMSAISLCSWATIDRQ